MKILFYLFFGVTALISGFYLVVSLFDSNPASSVRGKLFIGFASVLVMAALYMAYQAGEVQGCYGVGILRILLGWLLALVVFLIAIFTYKGPVNWQ